MEQGLKQMMDVPDLSQEDLEEMLKLLDSYETSSQRLAPVPEELQVRFSLLCGLSSMFCCSLPRIGGRSLILHLLICRS
jgi:hypothetical protein